MQEFTQQTFTEERALFHTIDARISDSVFDVGESPLKECRKLDIDTTLFRYKYPLWYCKDVSLKIVHFLTWREPEYGTQTM